MTTVDFAKLIASLQVRVEELETKNELLMELVAQLLPRVERVIR